MSYAQIYTFPKFVRTIVTGSSAIVIGAAGWLSFEMQAALARRISWTGNQAYLLPIAVEVYAANATLIWALAPNNSEAKRKAFQNVKVASGISWFLNILEHGWGYFEHHSEIGPEILLEVIVGSVPTLLIAAMLHMASWVLTPAQIPEALPEVSTVPPEDLLPTVEVVQEIPEVVLRQPEPEPEIPQHIPPEPEPAELPEAPEPQPENSAPEPSEPEPAPIEPEPEPSEPEAEAPAEAEPEPEADPFESAEQTGSELEVARVEKDKVILWIQKHAEELLKADEDPWKIITGGYLKRKFPEGPSERTFQKWRNAAIGDKVA